MVNLAGDRSDFRQSSYDVQSHSSFESGISSSLEESGRPGIDGNASEDHTYDPSSENAGNLQDSFSLSDEALEEADENPRESTEFQNSEPRSGISREKPENKSITNFEGTDKMDMITVTQAKDGSLEVDMRGETKVYSPEEAKNLKINGGPGKDYITINKDVTYNLIIDGGEGEDEITGGSGNDTIYGGKGNDKIYGGSGNDTLMGDDGIDYIEGGKGDDTVKGGKGNDVVYGLDGNDTLEGGAGNDYLDGGKGNDKLSGENGNDVVAGGYGDDALKGGDGEDVLVGAHGRDTLEAGEGKDDLFVQKDDKLIERKGDKVTVVDLAAKGSEPGSSIEVKGSQDFMDRVASDLETLRSLPLSRNMLSDLDHSAHKLEIVHADKQNYTVHSKDEDSMVRANGKSGKGTSSVINYAENRSKTGKEDWETRPPIVGFYHELVHADNAQKGTMQRGSTMQKMSDGSKEPVENREFQAIGLRKGNPEGYTENYLRSLFHLPLRPRY